MTVLVDATSSPVRVGAAGQEAPQNRWELLLRNRTIRSKTLAFLAGAGREIARRSSGGRPAFFAQAEVRTFCGLDPETVFGPTGCAGQALMLGLLHLDDRGRAGGVVRKQDGGFVGQAGQWSLGSGQFPPTSSSGNAVSSTTWVQDVDTHLAACSRELSGYQQRVWAQLMDPADDLWHALGYGHDWH